MLHIEVIFLTGITLLVIDIEVHAQVPGVMGAQRCAGKIRVYGFKRSALGIL